MGENQTDWLHQLLSFVHLCMVDYKLLGNKKEGMVIVEIIMALKWYQTKFSNMEAHTWAPQNIGWNFLS